MSRLLKRLASGSIIICLFLVASFLVHGVIEASARSLYGNYNLISDALYVCQPIPFAQSGRMAVLRLDDVQAFSWSEVSMRIIDDALSRGFPVVVGVIPKGFSSDQEMERFLHKRVCSVEVALHGWDHGGLPDGSLSGGEFEFLSEAEAYDRLEKGLEVLARITDKPILTFIPPQNRASEASQAAIAGKGMRVLSGEGGGYYDYGAAMWHYGTGEFVGSARVASACEDRFKTQDLCVIMLHPQDFVIAEGKVDAGRYGEYLGLLDYLSTSAVSVVRLSDIEEAKAGEAFAPGQY